MRFRSALWFLCVLALLWMASGCRKYEGSDASEQQHPTLQKARELVQRQDLPGAAALCEELLRRHPGIVHAHLQLGMIYQSLNEPIKALYHYQNYLERRPDSAKAEIIRQVIEDERRRLAPRSETAAAAGTDAAALAARLEQAEQALARSRIEMEQLRLRQPGAQNPPADWEQERIRLLTEIDQLRRDNARLAGPRATPTPGATPLPAGPRMYTVQPGDTLGRIAQKMYGEASQWRKIQDANRDKISDLRNLKPGMSLVIP